MTGRPAYTDPLTRSLMSTRFYDIWRNMRQRCSNPNASGYSRYGARGISVCERWADFDAFVADMYGSYHDGLTLERIDNDGPYSPENCRWATRAEQMQNTSRRRELTHDGRTQSVKEWCDELGLSRSTVGVRLHRGWSTARALGFE